MLCQQKAIDRTSRSNRACYSWLSGSLKLTHHCHGCRSPLLGSTLQRRSYMAMNHQPEKQTSQVTYLSSIESQNPWMEAQPTFSRCYVLLVCSPYAHPCLGRCIDLPPEVSRSHTCAQLITSTTWSSAGPIVRAPVPLTTANPLFFSPPHPYQLLSKSGHFLTSALSEHRKKISVSRPMHRDRTALVSRRTGRNSER